MTKVSRYNNKFEAVQIAVQKNFKDVQIPEVSTEEKYISLSANIHGKFSKDDRNLDVGTMTVFIDTLSQILMIEDDNQFLEIMHQVLDHSEVIEEEIGGIAAMTGTQEYVSIRKYSDVLHGEEFDFILVSENVEKAILNQLRHIDINNAKNLRLLVRDLNDCGRMYQELTLDAAKKLYEVIASFYQEFVRAESTIHLSHNPVNFNRIINSTDKNGVQTDAFKIFRTGYEDIDMELEVGEYNSIASAQGTKKILPKDNLAEIQNSNIASIEQAVNEIGVEGYKQTDLTKDTINDLDLVGNNKELAKDLVELIVNPYHSAIKLRNERKSKLDYRKLSKDAYRKKEESIRYDVNLSNAERNRELAELKKFASLTDFEAATYATQFEEQFNETVAELSNLARFYTKDLTMVQAGRVLFAASHIIVNGGDRNISMREIPSKAYLNIAPELAYAYISATQGDLKVCGFPLLGKTSLVQEGDVLEFSCGNAINIDGVYIDDNYTGTLRVETVNDVLSAVIDIEELLEANRIPHTAPQRIFLRMLGSQTFDAEAFLNDETVKSLGSFNSFDKNGGFSKATSLTLHPVFRTKNKIRKNVIVGSIPSPKDPSITVNVPLCGYLCFSKEIEKVFAGLTITSITKKNITDKMAWGLVEFGDNPTYVEVERRFNDDMINDIFGQVPEFDSTNDFGYIQENNITQNISNEELDAFEQQAQEMGFNNTGCDAFGDVTESQVNTTEKTSNTLPSGFDDEINLTLENLGLNLEDVSDFSAFQ